MPSCSARSSRCCAPSETAPSETSSVWDSSVWDSSVWDSSVWGSSVWDSSVWGSSVWGSSVWVQRHHPSQASTARKPALAVLTVRQSTLRSKRLAPAVTPPVEIASPTHDDMDSRVVRTTTLSHDPSRIETAPAVHCRNGDVLQHPASWTGGGIPAKMSPGVRGIRLPWHPLTVASAHRGRGAPTGDHTPERALCEYCPHGHRRGGDIASRREL